MYDILIGNKKDNVVNKLKTSWIARILFIGCCWYLYDMFGKSRGLRIEMIFMIAVIGIMLMNVFYIPFRLLGDKRIEHRVKLIFIVVADVMALHFFNATERFSIASVWKNMISVVVISLCVTGIISTYINVWQYTRKENHSCRGILTTWMAGSLRTGAQSG